MIDTDEVKEEIMLKEVKAEKVSRVGENPKVKEEFANGRKAKALRKALHSTFWKTTKQIRDDEESWLWLKRGSLKKETKGLILASQNLALRTNWVKNLIDKEDLSPNCRMCGKQD